MILDHRWRPSSGLSFRAKRELFSIARFLRDEICFFFLGEATP
jgi:hypothetical protein